VEVAEGRTVFREIILYFVVVCMSDAMTVLTMLLTNVCKRPGGETEWFRRSFDRENSENFRATVS